MPQTDLAKGGIVAERSFLILVLVGIVEVLAGSFSFSVALIADGVQSFADAVVSLIVWTGLRLSRRAPDGRFHFGYYRVETFSSFLAAFFMSVLGIGIIYQAYLEFLSPTGIVNAEVASAVALAATLIASIQFIYKTRAAKRYGSLALKTDAFNSIKDILTSLTAFFGIIFSKYLGIPETDGIAGIIIALFVLTVAYTIIKEASLVLMDACQCGDIVSQIENTAKAMPNVKGVHDIRLRRLGPYVVGDMHIDVDGKMTVDEAHVLVTQIEEKIKQQFDEIAEIKVRIEPHSK